MARAYQNQEQTQESEPMPWRETKTLPGDLKYLALGHPVSHKWQGSTRNECSLWLSPTGEMSCQPLHSLSTAAEAQEKLKPLQSESGLKLVPLWSLVPELHLAHRFSPVGYFSSLHLKLLFPWHKHLLLPMSAASSLKATQSLCLSPAAT